MNKANELYQKYVENEVSIIPKQHVLNTERVNVKVLAFLSELGKLSEESECFNFWQKEVKVEKEEVLDIYLDALSLLLSIGYELNVDSIKNYNELVDRINVIDSFYKVYEGILKVKNSYRFDDYQNCIDDYFSLGFNLGLDFDEIIERYLNR